MIPLSHRNQSLLLQMRPGAVCITNDVGAKGIAEGIAEGITRITTFNMNPVAKSEWVLCAITISPVLVALPVAMNALHRPCSRTTVPSEPRPSVPSVPSVPLELNESWFFS